MQMTCTYTHSCNLTRAFPAPPVGTWEKQNVPLVPRMRHIYHISSLAGGLLSWSVNGKVSLKNLWRGGAVAFETMAAVYVEVEPVLWEGGKEGGLVFVILS